MKPGWEVENGVPFYKSPKARWRSRGQWRTCLKCGAEFPSAMGNPGTYCSRSCTVKSRANPGTLPNARQDLFEHPTREECYLLGLIWSDGCLTGTGCRKVQFVSTDLELAEHASRISGAPVRTRLRVAPLKTAYVVGIGGRAVMDRVEALGLTRRKSHSASMPAVPHVADFVRGYFDGDGAVGLYRNPNLRRPEALPRLMSGFIGSHQLMAELQVIMEERAGITPKKIGASGSVWCLQYNHRDSLRLADYLYAEEGPCLSRKKAIFDVGAAQPFPASTKKLQIAIVK